MFIKRYFKSDNTNFATDGELILINKDDNGNSMLSKHNKSIDVLAVYACKFIVKG